MTRALPLAAALALAATAASAHGAWIEESHGNLAVIYGHGASDEAYEPARVTRLQACDAAAACADLPRIEAATHVEVAPPEGATAIALEFDNGFWSQGPDGEWVQLPPAEVEGVTASGRYLKHSTAILDHLPDGGLAPLGMALEIVPLSDPLDMAAGDMLRVQVLYQGEPLPGAGVIADYVNDSEAEPIVAGEDGIAEVPLRNNGKNVLAVNHTGPGADGTDETGHTATLTLTLHSHDD